jgi:hypothetical protein
MREITAVGDLDSDGRRDLPARHTDTGTLYLYGWAARGPLF